MFSFVGSFFKFNGLVVDVPTGFEGMFKFSGVCFGRIESVFKSFTHSTVECVLTLYYGVLWLALSHKTARRLASVGFLVRRIVRSPLPATPDYAKAEKLCIELIEEYHSWKNH